MSKAILRKFTLARILHILDHICEEEYVTQNLNRFGTKRASRDISQWKRQRTKSDW